MIEIRGLSIEASPQLVGPFKDVARVVNGRITGILANEDLIKIYLRHNFGRRLYSVKATEPTGRLYTQVEVPGQEPVSTEVLGGKLEIGGIQLDESGNPVGSLETADFPRNPDDITVASLLRMRLALPSAVSLLAEELRTAELIPAEVYYQTVDAMARGCN